MSASLHIMTQSEDTFARQIIELGRNGGDGHAGVVDLTVPEPDYESLLEQIFAADSVTVW